MTDSSSSPQKDLLESQETVIDTASGTENANRAFRFLPLDSPFMRLFLQIMAVILVLLFFIVMAIFFNISIAILDTRPESYAGVLESMPPHQMPVFFGVMLLLTGLPFLFQVARDLREATYVQQHDKHLGSLGLAATHLRIMSVFGIVVFLFYRAAWARTATEQLHASQMLVMCWNFNFVLYAAQVVLYTYFHQKHKNITTQFARASYLLALLIMMFSIGTMYEQTLPLLRLTPFILITLFFVYGDLLQRLNR